MKKSALILISILLTCPFIFCQGFVSEENTWNVMTTGYPGFLGTESYKIEGDSLYNGHDYKMIWMTMDSVDLLWSYKGMLREEDDVVYYIQQGIDTESVLYDFNALPGDTVWMINMFCWEDIPAVISDIDTVEYYGVERKRWVLQQEWGYPEYWIEGIGSNLGPLHSLYSLCIVCPTWDLLCFHHAGTQYYQMPGTFKCFMTNVGIDEDELEMGVQIVPNPVRDKFEVLSSEFEVGSVVIFNLSGKKMLEQQFSGEEMNVEVDVSGFDAGMYVARIDLQGRMLTKKLLVY
jgi:hypothetical protein